MVLDGLLWATSGRAWHLLFGGGSLCLFGRSLCLFGRDLCLLRRFGLRCCLLFGRRLLFGDLLRAGFRVKSLGCCVQVVSRSADGLVGLWGVRGFGMVFLCFG